MQSSANEFLNICHQNNPWINLLDARIWMTPKYQIYCSQLSLSCDHVAHIPHLRPHCSRQVLSSLLCLTRLLGLNVVLVPLPQSPYSCRLMLSFFVFSPLVASRSIY